MNTQTPGPLKDDNLPIDGFHTLVAPDGLEVCEVTPENGPANTALLAAAYSSYDKAGRALKTDATQLAQRLDLESLLRFVWTIKDMAPFTERGEGQSWEEVSKLNAAMFVNVARRAKELCVLD